MRVSCILPAVLLSSSVLGAYIPGANNGEAAKRNEDCSTSSTPGSVRTSTFSIPSPSGGPSSSSTGNWTLPWPSPPRTSTSKSLTSSTASATDTTCTTSLTSTSEDPSTSTASSTASLTTSQPPLPDPLPTCDPHCHCATGGKPVPTEGRWLCGWCGAVSTDPEHFLNVTDVVQCKDNGCCNYGKMDGRCEKSLYEQPPNFDVWCPWPVQQLDPPSTELPVRPTSSKHTTVPFPTWTGSKTVSVSHGTISSSQTPICPTSSSKSLPHPSREPTSSTASTTETESSIMSSATLSEPDSTSSGSTWNEVPSETHFPILLPSSSEPSSTEVPTSLEAPASSTTDLEW